MDDQQPKPKPTPKTKPPGGTTKKNDPAFTIGPMMWQKMMDAMKNEQKVFIRTLNGDLYADALIKFLNKTEVNFWLSSLSGESVYDSVLKVSEIIEVTTKLFTIAEEGSDEEFEGWDDLFG